MNGSLVIMIQEYIRKERKTDFSHFFFLLNTWDGGKMGDWTKVTIVFACMQNFTCTNTISLRRKFWFEEQIEVEMQQEYWKGQYHIFED